MYRKILIYCGLILLILFSTGCLSFRSYPGGIEPESTVLKTNNYEVLGEAEGTASSFNLLWFLRVTPRADLNRAIRNAIAKKGGQALIDVRWWRERKVYIIGSVTVLHVKGTVIRYIK